MAGPKLEGREGGTVYRCLHINVRKDLLLNGIQLGLRLGDMLGMGRSGFGHLALQNLQAPVFRSLFGRRLRHLGVVICKLRLASFENLLLLLKLPRACSLFFFKRLQAGFHLTVALRGRLLLGERIVMSYPCFDGLLPAWSWASYEAA